jgi:HPt (histidine-containing phosphotransfer) domain-containing protein
MQSVQTTEQVYSKLADDPDLAELVEMYVANLPQLLATLARHADHGKWRTLARVAHQLKGSSGCSGFDEVSSRAARLEETCRRGCPEREILSALAELEQFCGRVRSKRRPK